MTRKTLTKKLLTMGLAFGMLCMTASAAGVTPGTTKLPAVPSTLLVNETFEEKAGKTIGEKADDIYTPLSNFNSGGVINLNGNQVLSVYSKKDATSTRSWQVPVNIADLTTPVTSGYLVYEADIMLPNVAPEGQAKVAGGTAYLALNHFTASVDKCPGKESCPTYTSHNDSNNSNNEHRGLGSGRVGVYMQAGKLGFMYNQTSKSLLVDYPVEADTWYNIKLVVDMQNGTYDVYVDDRLAITNLSFDMGKGAIVNACVGALNIANMNITKGWLLGDGTRAGETKEYKGDPRAAYYDNIKLYQITKDDAIAHTKAGFEACFDVTGTRKDVNLPRPGYFESTPSDVTQHGVSYSTAFENTAVFALNNYAQHNDITESIKTDKERKGAVTRPASGEADAEGTVTMHYVKGDVDFSHTVSITVPAQREVSGFSGVEIGDVVLKKTATGAEALVYAGNTSASDFEATVILCSYEEGNKLSGIEIYPLKIKASDEDTLSFTFEKDTASDAEVKAFVWLWNGLKPVSMGSLSLLNN